MKEPMDFVARIVNHENPIVYIHTIINEIRTFNKPFYNSSSCTIYYFEVYALIIYSLLYYRYKDNDVYKGSILSHLQKLLGYCLSVHSNFFYHERKNLPVKE